MNPVEKLKELFLKFPGIGPKQASRFVYFLLREKEDYKENLAKNIEALKNSSQICESCLKIFAKKNKIESSVCEICNDPNRDNQKLMILVKELDIEAIERTGFYNGKYFLLGNVLPFLTEKPSEIINIKELVNLISNNLKNENLEEKNKFQEIILSLPATDEGENTILYLQKTLSQIVGIEKIKISSLAKGISTGLDIEYIDKNTFKEAFNHRL